MEKKLTNEEKIELLENNEELKLFFKVMFPKLDKAIDDAFDYFNSLSEEEKQKIRESKNVA